jgi:hypothetical protein
MNDGKAATASALSLRLVRLDSCSQDFDALNCGSSAFQLVMPLVRLTNQSISCTYT